MNLPYTYRLSWTKADLHYYGCRSAKYCHPSDLWVTYFTSSEYVKEVVELHGPPDIVKVTRTFDKSEDAYDWESKFLSRVDARRNPKFINRSNCPFGPYMNLKGNFKCRASALKGVEGVRRKYGMVGAAVGSIKESVQKTNQQRYGVHHTLHLDQVREAREKACLDKYGVTNPFLSEDFQKSLANPMECSKARENHKRVMENYDWSKRNSKSKRTVRCRYGVDYITQSGVFKEKSKETTLKRYGVENYALTQEFRDRMAKLKRPCPFMCRDGYAYDPGNLSKHMTKVHGWTKDQINQLKSEEEVNNEIVTIDERR